VFAEEVAARFEERLIDTRIAQIATMPSLPPMRKMAYHRWCSEQELLGSPCSRTSPTIGAVQQRAVVVGYRLADDPRDTTRARIQAAGRTDYDRSRQAAIGPDCPSGARCRSGQNALEPDLLRRGPSRGLAGSIGIRDPGRSDPGARWYLADRRAPIIGDVHGHACALVYAAGR
jgi:hypothetical protein